MKKEALKRIFEFLEDKEEHKAPFIWKLENDIPLTEEDLNIEGNLYLRDSEITSLPKGLKVCGWLDLSRSKIKSLPEGLKVGGDLNLTYTEITSLPEGLEVGGTLYLYKSALVEYTDEELREMVKPGFIQGKIYR
jgi:hypothetical protein